MKVNIYIYIKLDLEGEVHWIWDLWINGLQECKGNGFFEVGQADSSFQLGLENLDFLDGWLPKCSSTKKFMGGGGEGGEEFNVSPTKGGREGESVDFYILDLVDCYFEADWPLNWGQRVRLF